jgi:fatty-acyl-CoA synthase
MEPPQARTFGGLLREMASRLPNRPAIAFEGEELSFQEVDKRVDEMAKGLLSLRVRRGDMVSILTGNRPEWLIYVFAAARIGCVVAPINTWYKDEEIAYALRHSGARVLLTAGRLLNQDFSMMLRRIAPSLAAADGTLPDPNLPDLQHLIELDGQHLPASLTIGDVIQRGPGISQTDLQQAEDAVQPQDMAFVLYTSGSTASPKGVQLHHEPAIKNDFQIGERQHLDHHDRVWLAIPLFYAFAAVNAVPAAWTHGACLVLQEHFDPGKALELIEQERATVFYGLGNMTRALLTHPDFATRDVSSLEKGVTGFSAEDKRLAIQDLGVDKCCSIYGSTEGYGNCAVTDADDPLEVRLETQGFPLPDWEFRIVDPQDEQREMPPGETGLLLIRGYVTTGYFKDPENTFAAFTDDGFFRTGDLAAIDQTGRLRFHSRATEMIKVGGINVSPLEVEQLIDAHPNVRQVHVVGVPDAAKGEIVVAFIEPTIPTLDEEEIRSFVRERAASFKVPKYMLKQQALAELQGTH